MTQKSKHEKRPASLECTVTTPIIGVDFDDETGQKRVHEPGDDVRMPYAKAIRLANMSTPRVLIDEEEREAFKAQLKKRGKAASAGTVQKAAATDKA